MANPRTRAASTAARAPATPKQIVPSVDGTTAIGIARTVAKHVAKPAEKARFRSLPAAEFDASVIDALSARIEAAATAHTAYVRASSGETRGMLPADLVQSVIVVRTRMLSCVSHNLVDDEVALREIAAIRRGNGYGDLSSDLLGLAALYADHAAELRGDRFYQAGDAAEATRLASEIQEGLGKARRGGSRRAYEAWASAFSELVAAYEEIAAAGRWLDRHRGDVGERYPSLFRRTTRKRTRKSDPTE